MVERIVLPTLDFELPAPPPRVRRPPRFTLLEAIVGTALVGAGLALATKTAEPLLILVSGSLIGAGVSLPFQKERMGAILGSVIGPCFLGPFVGTAAILVLDWRFVILFAATLLAWSIGLLFHRALPMVWVTFVLAALSMEVATYCVGLISMVTGSGDPEFIDKFFRIGR